MFGASTSLLVCLDGAANDVEYGLGALALAVYFSVFLNRTTDAITAKRARSSSLSN